jgi:argininosuccinate synthase
MRTRNQIRSFDDIEVVTERCGRILTLFSGGVDSSYVLRELARHGRRDVIALTVDLGDGVDRMELQQIASYFGARSLVVDAQDVFAKEAVLPALRANARYMSMYPISASLSRPIIARIAVEVAAAHDCQAIIHTANQSQNSLRRLNGAISQLGFPGFYGTPYEYSALTREEKIEGLSAAGWHSHQSRGTSGDSNLWCREFESGSLDNPEEFEVPENLFQWTARTAGRGERTPLTVQFRDGVPTEIDGRPMSLVELIARLNHVVGRHGVGRFAGLEHLEFNEKVLEVREAPAAFILMDAYRHLETATLEPELMREKLGLEQVWVREAVEGRWYGDLRAAVDEFIRHTARRINGTVSYVLQDGLAEVCSIRADCPLYLTHRDEWEKQVASIRGARGLRETLSVDRPRTVPAHVIGPVTTAASEVA